MNLVTHSVDSDDQSFVGQHHPNNLSPLVALVLYNAHLFERQDYYILPLNTDSLAFPVLQVHWLSAAPGSDIVLKRHLLSV